MAKDSRTARAAGRAKTQGPGTPEAGARPAPGKLDQLAARWHTARWREHREMMSAGQAHSVLPEAAWARLPPGRSRASAAIAQ